MFDNEYTQLCAEMAYNEVIVMESLNEDYGVLQEGSIIDKAKEIFAKFMSFIKRIYEKVKKFIISKLNILKQKIRDKKAKKAKNESTYYNNLMSMILTEEEQESINWEYVYDIMYPTLKDISDNIENKLDEFTKKLNEFVDTEDYSDKYVNSIIDEKIDDAYISYTKVFNFKGQETKEFELSRQSKDSILDTFRIAKNDSMHKKDYKSKYDFDLVTIKEMERGIRFAEDEFKDIRDTETTVNRYLEYCDAKTDKEKENAKRLITEVSKYASKVHKATFSVTATCSAILYEISMHMI